jgi:hypothetical protein
MFANRIALRGGGFFFFGDFILGEYPAIEKAGGVLFYFI